jgi:hypothetical protein
MNNPNFGQLFFHIFLVGVEKNAEAFKEITQIKDSAFFDTTNLLQISTI